MSVQNKYPFYLSTVIGAILIGLAPILMRYSEVSPSMTGFYRFFFAFLILLIYGAIKGKKFFVNTNLYILALPGIFFGADIALWHTAIMITPVTNAALLVNTAPIYVGIISFLFFKERISKLFLISLILSFIGVSLIILNLQNFDVFLGKNLRGDLLSFFAGSNFLCRIFGICEKTIKQFRYISAHALLSFVWLHSSFSYWFF